MESLVKQLNLGGPGWIADICDVRLFLGEPGGTQRLAELAPTEIEVEDEPDAPAIFVPLLSNGEAPAGTVVVTPPPGRHVSHHGVTVTLEATLIHFIDGYEPSTTSMIAQYVQHISMAARARALPLLAPTLHAPVCPPTARWPLPSLASFGTLRTTLAATL